MFEITGDDVQRLNDADLRTLVTRLATAELAAQKLPISCVTAGGHQDAPDGGVDVRVASNTNFTNADFVPRRSTGFQVKKPNMSATAIRAEMRPKGRLREVISALANEGGSYIIVSAQGSTADKPLQERKSAMRRALGRLKTASQLHTDFYDRDRIAAWVNQYPGVAAWVRERAGRQTSGWRAIGNWTDSRVGLETEYLSDAKTCLIDERSSDREELALEAGIKRIRDSLRKPGSTVRLIGLSGLGKTRLVQALFETEVGGDALDAGVAIYTDYSETPDPTARDMARHLAETAQRAVLVVDNCNPTVHSELARICSTAGSNVSLITVEYDVKDDEPERTEVFRLEAASKELLAKWLKLTFPHIQQPDRERVADFSDGNFRVARALAETLSKGETLGHLKDRELFSRIFQQRNQPSESLLLDAEDLALLYSFDGDETSEDGELAVIARIRSLTARELFTATTELKRRGVIQSRGRWRAILPQAIANRLASYALERISPRELDRFASALPPRMLKSLTRRLGYLHDVPEAEALVARWLMPDGPLGNLVARGDVGLEMLTNLAPVAPEAALARIELELDGPNGTDILSSANTDRWRWINLIKALAYDAHLFEDAATALSRFVASEAADNKSNSARDAFGELFHLYLSGTNALPGQRRDFIRRLSDSGNYGELRAASVALDALLQAGHFSATHAFDFGARPRDWGWWPRINGDLCDWFNEAITLAVQLADRLPDARSALAGSLRELWPLQPCHDAIQMAALAFAEKEPWIEGWLALRVAFQFDHGNMSDASRQRLVELIDKLKPTDLLNRARAFVLNTRGSWDITDGEDETASSSPWERADRLAVEAGKMLASDSSVRTQFVAEVLVAENAPRAFQFGQGLAIGAASIRPMWQELVETFQAANDRLRSATLLGGFFGEAHRRHANFAEPILDGTIENPHLANILPYLQAQVGIDECGVSRLRRAIDRRAVNASSFSSLASGAVRPVPADALQALLVDISNLEDGVDVAIDILQMKFYCSKQDGHNYDQSLIECGRNLLQRVDFNRKTTLRDHGLRTIARVCLVGAEAEPVARTVCERVRASLEEYRVHLHDVTSLLDGLFKIQPFVALDAFLLPDPPEKNSRIFDPDGTGSPIEKIDASILTEWADRDPGRRYTVLGRCLPIIDRNPGGGDAALSPKFMQLLDRAPDKPEFLGDFWQRIHPRGWSGSLADVLVGRRQLLKSLESHSDADVRQWFVDMQWEFERWIARERERERGQEESFE